MTRLTRFKILATALFMMVAAGLQVAVAATTETLVYSFDGTNGAVPMAGVIQGKDGNFYGTTSDTNTITTKGHIYKLTPGGTITTLHAFDGIGGTLAGMAPETALVQGSDGAFYGTTNQAAGGSGSVFKVTADGTFTNLYTFNYPTNATDGSEPLSALVEGTDGNFYGTTIAGGINVLNNCGTVFKITPSGTLTTIYAFDCVAASQPSGDIVFGADGALYGTTQAGGTAGYGTIYKLAMDGTLTVLHSFNLTDGSLPVGGLMLGSDGNFYGTTSLGGSSSEGAIFKIAPDGTFTSLHSLSGLDGSAPNGTLVEGKDGNFYGATSQTIFQITPSGTYTKLLDLSKPATNGAAPFGDLILATDGALYGTTSGGGANNDGVVYKVALSTSGTTGTPTFSPAAGTYSAPQSVTISDTTAGATIYYTVDGSTPTTSSTQYTGPITVSTTATVNAIAVSSGNQNSAVATVTYTITQTGGGGSGGDGGSSSGSSSTGSSSGGGASSPAMLLMLALMFMTRRRWVRTSSRS